MGFGSNLSTHIICVCSSNEEKTTEDVVQAYLSGIIVQKGRSVVILSNNGTKFKNKV